MADWLRDILATLAGGGLIGTISTLLFQYLKDKYSHKQKLELENSAAASEERINYSTQLVAIHQKIVAAEHEWAQKEIDLKVAKYVAEDRLARCVDDCTREKREIHRLAEDQHVEIVELNAKLEQKNVEIRELNKQLTILRDLTRKDTNDECH